MKKTIFLFFAVIFLTFAATTPWADTSKDESALEEDVQELDEAGGQGENAIVDRLEEQFEVDEAVIQGLRDKKLGYGEITITLALADKLEGGITDANIDQILAMRGADGKKEGWGVIAKKLGFKLGPVISDVEMVKAGAKVEKTDSGASTAGKEKIERAERPERIEKSERPGRGNK